MSKKTIAARPAPGTLFSEALGQFEESLLKMVRAGEQYPSTSREYHEARLEYDRKRAVIIDYVVALERGR